MRIWTVIWLILVALVVAFAALNWSVLTAPTTIHLVLADITAPLGVTMLAAMAGLAALFLVFLVWLETRTLTELGRSARAERAGGSETSALLAELSRSVSELRTEHAESARLVIARTEDLERALNAQRTTEMR